jgi:tetratricopeptide (TPR) repeat protein
MPRVSWPRAIVLFLVAATACHRESSLSKLAVARAKRKLGTISRPRLVPGDGVVAFRDADPLDVLVRQCVASGDFAPVAAKAEELLPQQNDDDRSFDLYELYRAFDVLGREENAEAVEQAVSKWVSQAPASHVALTARGFLRIGRGWEARGEGWSDSVSPEARSEFHRLLELGRTDLEKARSLQPGDPNPSVGLMMAGLGLGVDRTTMENDYRLALKASPGHYVARATKLRYLMPKWFGSEGEMLEFALECTQEAKVHPYAALIEPAALLEEHLFPDTMFRSMSTIEELASRSKRPPKDYLSYEAPWRRVSDAYETFLDTHPDHLRARYWYAELAYRAKQWDVFVEQAEAIGDRWAPTSSWSSQQSYRKDAAIGYRRYAYDMKLPDREDVYYTRHAVALDSDNAEVRYSYAVDLHQLDRREEAAAQYRRAIALDPRYPRPYAGLISLLVRMQQCSEVQQLSAASRGLEFNAGDSAMIQHAVEVCSRHGFG